MPGRLTGGMLEILFPAKGCLPRMTDPAPSRYSGPALASFAIGLFALLTNLTFLRPPAALVAIVLAAIGWKQTTAQSVAGRNLAVVGLCAGVFSLFVLPLTHILFRHTQPDLRGSAAVKTNENYAIEQLKTYWRAQQTVKEKGYGPHLNPESEAGYCRRFPQLSEIITDRDGTPGPLVSDEFARATAPEVALHGYYFLQGPVSETSFILYAFPAKYGVSGVLSFRVDEKGRIHACDLDGAVQQPEKLADLRWETKELISTQSTPTGANP